ncbi:MAG: single-stranded-DNA-specific exonuclease RecJ [Spirosomataceae bacterium]
MTEKRWQQKPLPKSTEELQIVQQIEQELSIERSLATLLWQRGIADYDSAKNFFRPKLEDLHDPFLMKDMQKAVERLELAIRSNEKIMIFGDYDVDGTTAVALVYGFLSTFYENLEYYNPDRYKEGYGVSDKGIEWASEQSVTLIIALDCGIKSVDKVAWAKEKFGIEFIICDHHEPGETLPPAVAVLDPKRKDCTYPFKELTGNGVGFKLLTAYCLRNNIPLENLFEYLDLAVISIGSDIVPIVGENRILAYYGMKKLNATPRIGIQVLKEIAGFTTEMNIQNVVFVIGPRINAAGRIKHAKAAVQLLLSKDYNEATAFAQEIHDNNAERKTHDSRITEQAVAMIEADRWMLNEAKSTVLFQKDWHKGVVGIVASRCIERYYRPTIILTESKGVAAGSARSVAGFDLYAAVEACSEHLEQFGGHTHAAGMTLPLENVVPFKRAFDSYVRQHITEEQLVPKIEVDLEVNLSDITAKFYRIMQQMSPFGPQNMQPVFMTKGLSLAAKPRILKEKHFKLELLEEETGMTLTALGFGMTEQFYKPLLQHKYFDATYTIETNTFRGNTSLQLFLKDIKFSEE